MKTICICGGGSLGHVVAGFLSAKGKACVNVLTREPHRWSRQLTVTMPDGESIAGNLDIVSSDPADVIPGADVVLLCMPGYAIRSELQLIAPYTSNSTFVGCVFSSTGFFFDAFEVLPQDVPLWGLQRVPFEARVNEYGHSAKILGAKNRLYMAVERSDDKSGFADIISQWFGVPVTLLNNYLEASLTNSNPLLHTSRLYSLFGNWHPGVTYDRCPLFYAEWTDKASEIYVAMDNELFKLISVLPVDPDYLETVLQHYESRTIQDLTSKISSIPSLHALSSPMIQTPHGWVPDLHSRYFVEDFERGLHFVKSLSQQHNIQTPIIDLVYGWYVNQIKPHS